MNREAPNVDLHIDLLSLEGIDISPGERANLAGALQSELARLLMDYGIPPGMRQGSNVPVLRAPKVSLTSPLRAEHAATHIASALYVSLGGVAISTDKR